MAHGAWRMAQAIYKSTFHMHIILHLIIIFRIIQSCRRAFSSFSEPNVFGKSNVHCFYSAIISCNFISVARRFAWRAGRIFDSSSHRHTRSRETNYENIRCRLQRSDGGYIIIDAVSWVTLWAINERTNHSDSATKKTASLTAKS